MGGSRAGTENLLADENAPGSSSGTRRHLKLRDALGNDLGRSSSSAGEIARTQKSDEGPGLCVSVDCGHHLIAAGVVLKISFVSEMGGASKADLELSQIRKGNQAKVLCCVN